MIKKESLPDRPKFCQSGSVVRHLFWRLSMVIFLISLCVFFCAFYTCSHLWWCDFLCDWSGCQVLLTDGLTLWSLNTCCGIMMTSSNGNVFRLTGPLCGEFTGHWWIPLTKASDSELWCFLWSALWINGWVNNREAGDLRRHCTHYDVTGMMKNINIKSLTPGKVVVILNLSFSDSYQG